MKNFICTINMPLTFFFKAICLAIILTIFCSGVSPAKVIYVNYKAAGNNNGTSWANAYTNLQSALQAATPGDSIWVAEGTYYPFTNTTTSFQIPNGVKVFGGFKGNETNFNTRNYKNNVTTLSGAIPKANNKVVRAYHVVTFVNTGISTTLDGFTIKGGWADTTITSTLDSVGGGVLIYSTNGNTCSPTINNCLITDNLAKYEGGGVCILSEAGGNSSPTLSQSEITGNKGVLTYFGSIVIDSTYINGADANGFGSGIAIDGSRGTCNPIFNNCSIVHNSYVLGGDGLYNDKGSLIMNNCTISHNGDDNSTGLVIAGAGISSTGGSLKMTGCNITYDNAYFPGSVGGGIFIVNTSLDLANDTISNNSATGGGGIEIQSDSSNKINSTIKNCVISNNGAYQGGGIEIYPSTSSMIYAKINQCKINNNKAYRKGGGIDVENADSSSQCTTDFTDCEFIGNSVDVSIGKGGGIYNGAGSSTFTNCKINEDSAASGGGIFNTLAELGNSLSNPIFTDCTISGNYASSNGGGIYSESNVDSESVNLINCIISGNYADTLGGGIYNYVDTTGNYYFGGINNFNAVVYFSLMNCTITGNYAGLKGEAIYNHSSEAEKCITTIKNSIIWNNKTNESAAYPNAAIIDYSASTYFSYSLIENSRDTSGTWIDSLGKDDSHNIDKDPLFKSVLNPSTAPSTKGDFHLKAGSPALGAGSPATDPGVPKTDIDGNPRPLPNGATNVDMGAYEEGNNTTNVKDNSSQIPKKFMLDQNYPNPFNPTTTIRYEIPKSAYVTLKVYDILGNVVETLVDKEQQPGRYSVTFPGLGSQESEVSQLASGVYLYRLQAGSYVQTKKMLLLK